MSQPLVLITGANQGIGLATAQILASKHNYHVIIGARNKHAGEEVAASLRSAGHTASSLELDLNSETSIKNAVATLERDFGYLDILINNAAVLMDLNKDLTPWELYSKTFTPNVIGTGVLTHYALPLIRKARATPPTIIFVSSSMGSLTYSFDKSVFWYPVDYKAYDASKAAVNVLVANYHRILEGEGGKVNAVCPGLVKTNLSGYMEAGSTPEVGATRIVELATAGEKGESGTFTDRNGTVPW
ncbi:hypothetical protein ASPVEDRAFT_485049 [Aspergillus versicolor CBS 583.65]|uniref:Uncharacterized protein n=1 Tax=Aspergillus versicolor CBS 583.65 TaxID=1036611 RepID=A0A1L9PBJ5_ASPVE|nr:uncharacterized protein ASPVEDRAFT_485049 [Aspergillus versicolor CBS 583.65]OJI98843.1 hypothetical protein ASPVEDRAFT_485049 [Aspergillus versicolor CBS 583.65]